MTIQIAVRLDDDLVAFLDEAVAQGRVGNRTEGVRVLEKWRREQRIAREIAILDKVKDDPDPELEAWFAHTSVHRAPLDD
jgi:Arc/MetJ-type ribon-helix-helix transcriptional regulator